MKAQLGILLATLLLGACASRQSTVSPVKEVAPRDTLVLPPEQRSMDVAHESFLRGLQMRQQGNPEMAEIFYLRAVAHDPTSRHLLMELAEVLATNGKHVEAISIVRRALAMDGKPTAQEYYILARMHRQNESLDSARIYYARSVQLDNRNVRVLFEYAMVLEIVQDYEELTGIYKLLLPLMDYPPQLLEKQLLLLRLSNDNAGVQDLLLRVWQSKGMANYLFQLVELLEEERKLDQAIELLEDARKRGVADGEVLHRLSRLLLRAGRPEQALISLMELYRQDTLRYDVLQRLAMLEFDLGMLDSAHARFNFLMQKRPEDHLTSFYLSNIASLKGDSAGAVQAAKRAINLRPDALAYRNQLAALYYLRNDYVRAHEVLDAAIAKNPNHPLPLQFKGSALLHEAGFIESRFPVLASAESQRARTLRESAMLLLLRAQALDSASLDILFDIAANYERLDSIQQSISWFERLLRLDPRHHQAMNYLGYLLVDRKIDLTRGGQLIDSALAMQPGNLAYLDSRAWYLHLSGRSAEALPILEQVEREGMNDPVVWEHLALICETLGLKDRARNYWKKVLQFNPHHALARERSQ